MRIKSVKGACAVGAIVVVATGAPVALAAANGAGGAEHPASAVAASLTEPAGLPAEQHPRRGPGIYARELPGAV